MKKRIFVTLLALVMALGLTVTAAAEETDLNTYLTEKTTQEVSVIYIASSSRSVEVTGYVLNDGSYKLGGDVTITAPLIVTGTVTLDLNGKALTYGGAAKNSVIVVKDSANFTLTDSSSGGKITGGTGTNWSVSNYGITTTRNYGGGVFVGSQATFQMEGGSIADCSVNSGDSRGGVYVSEGGNGDSRTTFTMTGGSIVRCSSGSQGGGVYAEGNTNFKMEGGRIADCTAASLGGGVCSEGTFTMTGGIIENCTATGYGGALASCENHCSVDAQGGCVRGDVLINRTFENSSLDTSVIFYGDVKKTVSESVYDTLREFTDNLVTFKNGETTYARTFFKEGGGKISQPDAPTAPEGKIFAGWYTAETGGNKWIFDTNTVSSNMTLYAQWHDLTEVPAKGATCTEPGNTQHWKCETCGKLFTDNTGATVTSPEAVTTEKNPNNHAEAGVWHSDSKNHWMTYPCCDTATAAEAHQLDGRTCTVCGYEQPGHEPIRRQNTTAVEDTTDTADTTVVASPKTFDVGVAVYGAMAALSLTGTAWVARKKF